MKKLVLFMLLSAAVPLVAMNGQEEALHTAAIQGNLATVRNLVENQHIDINRSINNMTPVELAAYNGQDAVVKYLLEQGAEKGQAAMWARHRNNFALAEFIENYAQKG